MKLSTASEMQEYTIDLVDVDDEELRSFLFSLGCYSGERITVIKQRKSGCIVVLKDSRYSIDSRLADSISVKE